MRLIIVFIIALCIMSCNKSKKGYYSNGNIKSEKYYIQKDKIDSTIYFFENSPGKIKSMAIRTGDSIKKVEFDSLGNKKNEGITFDNKKIGNWKFYKEDRLEVIKEYFLIEGGEYVNQSWYLDDKNDTLYENSYFFEIFTKDTHSIKEGFKAVAVLNVEWYKKDDSYIEVKISSGENEKDFNDDFSNEQDIVLATYHNLTFDESNKQWVDLNGNYQYAVAFGKSLEYTGNQYVKGYILEIVNQKKSNYLKRKQRKYYFKIPITVTE